MEILITGRNIGLGGSLKEYVNKKMSKLERLYSNIHECEVILEEEKLRKNVEVILHMKGARLIAKETETAPQAQRQDRRKKTQKCFKQTGYAGISQKERFWSYYSNG